MIEDSLEWRYKDEAGDAIVPYIGIGKTQQEKIVLDSSFAAGNH